MTTTAHNLRTTGEPAQGVPPLCGHIPDDQLLRALTAIFAGYLDGPLQLAGRGVVVRFRPGTPTLVKQAFAGALRHSRLGVTATGAQRAQRHLAVVLNDTLVRRRA